MPKARIRPRTVAMLCQALAQAASWSSCAQGACDAALLTGTWSLRAPRAGAECLHGHLLPTAALLKTWTPGGP